MYSISIGELQKNISLLTQLTEAFTIVDKRKNKSVATVYLFSPKDLLSGFSLKYSGLS